MEYQIRSEKFRDTSAPTTKKKKKEYDQNSGLNKSMNLEKSFQ